MNKNLLIMGGGIIIVGSIVVGVLSSNEEVRDKSQDYAEIMEELYFEDFLDEERYSFCNGYEEIKGTYTSATILGDEKGDVEYISEEISVFDKERNKSYILGRKINYKYSGSSVIAFEGGYGTMEITEEGSTTEYYSKFTAPVRIDYGSKVINIAPERKNTNWVVVETKGTGTLMGLTQERIDKETGDAKVFCSGVNLDGAFISPDYFFLEKACSHHSPGIGTKFSGNFKFECGGVENTRGIKLAKEYKLLETVKQEFDEVLKQERDAINENLEDNDPGAEFRRIIPEGSSDDSDMREKIQQMKDEMKRDAILEQ